MEQLVVGIIFVLSLLIGPLWWWILNSGGKNRVEGEDKSMGLQKEENSGNNLETLNDDRVLHPINWKKFQLMEAIQTSHNTKLLKFSIPNHQSLGLPVGRHLSVMAHIDGNKVMRPYTPVSRPDEYGSFSLLIKSYEFGKMSNHLFHLNVGETLEVRGPVGRFKYSTNMYKHMVFICGGTGLTPCLQVIRWILEGPNHLDEQTQLTLFYQNRTLQDILLLSTLEKLEKTHSKLKIFYYLSDPSEDWGKAQGSQHDAVRRERRGYIHEDNLRHEHIFPEKCDLACICGPSGFNEKMVSMLERLGFDKGKNIYIW